MNSRLSMALLFVMVLLGGCAKPQSPVAFDQSALTAKPGRIGVGTAPLPKPTVLLPGANCLLCLLVATGANSSLRTHSDALPYEDLPKLKDLIAERLRKKGLDAVVISEDINVNSLDDFSSDVPNSARKNFSPLQKKYNVDRLIVIHIKSLGFIREYSSYFPTSDPKSMINSEGYLVNLSNNIYEWYLPVNLTRSAEKSWDEPPKFPGLTNAYFQVLETAKDRFLEPFNQ